MTVLAIIFVIVPLVIGVGNHIVLSRKEANIEIEGALQGLALAQVHEKYQTKKSINAALALSFIAFPIIFLLQPLTK